MAGGLLIALPDGLSVSGVASWAVRLANALAGRGCETALLLHPEPPGQEPVPFQISPRVRVIRPPGLERFGAGDPREFLPAYREAVRSLAGGRGAPVVLSPNLHGDCYGVAAALCAEDPGMLRVVGWQHSDNEYDARVLAHFEPVLSRFVAVSDRIEAVLRERLPAGRLADIENIAYGVEVAGEGGGGARPEGGPVRMIYSGRLEHRQKRVLAIAHLSAELGRRGVAHELTVAGDGPASDELRAAVASMPCVRLLGAQPPGRVRELLGGHDLFVLPSRFEGLSVAMLEAMGAGCIPVVARVASGAMQAIEPGVNGEIADVQPEADEEETGRAMADAVQRAMGRGLHALRDAARRTVIERFSLERHVHRVSRLLDGAAASPARTWPGDRSCGLSVPAGGAERMRRVLGALAGRAVVVHGAGDHTRQLAGVFVESPARIVAFADDDRAVHGTELLTRPVIAPAGAASCGATDVVISSWMHESAIWARRVEYERQGLRVWRVYA